MIRDLQCNGFKLKALKHDSISKYEILLPEKYRMIYKGLEMFNACETSRDIYTRVFDNEYFEKLITVVNLNPRIIPHYHFLRYNDRDGDLEKFKDIVSACSTVHIRFNDDNTLDDITYSYQHSEVEEHFEQEFLFCDDWTHEEDYFARERY